MFLICLPMPPSAPSRQSGFEQSEPRSKPGKVELLNLTGAAVYHTFASFEQALADGQVAGCARNVTQSTHESKADCSVRDRIVADLFESQIEKAVEIDPGNDDPENMRRVVVVAPRWRSACPPDHYGAELIDRADRGQWIVDRRRDRPQCDVDDLHDAEFDVLLQGASSGRGRSPRAAEAPGSPKCARRAWSAARRRQPERIDRRAAPA